MKEIINNTPKNPIFGVRERDAILTMMTYFEQLTTSIEEINRYFDGNKFYNEPQLKKSRELLKIINQRLKQ